ncbi:hypothetical protein [Phaeacidiphilus oryzae]|uniref:hypothetical protein n=1 Tax=Phaeacidiphilus oryzae TaxID=348818 RepID=UPI00055CA61F|nr:hypothetical protein [Phaeacidiphilus oryzae]
MTAATSRPRPRPADRPQDPVRPEAEELHHRRILLLGQISTDGLAGLARVLRAARDGDPAAASMNVGSVLRALPGMGWFGAHDLLRSAGLRERDLLRDLTAAQRGELCLTVSHLPPPPS